jgi:hypothetical protein
MMDEDVEWTSVPCGMKLFGYLLNCTKPQDHSGDHFNHIQRQAWSNDTPPAQRVWRSDHE